MVEQARLESIRLGNSEGLTGSGEIWGWYKYVIPEFNDLAIIGLSTYWLESNQGRFRIKSDHRRLRVGKMQVSVSVITN